MRTAVITLFAGSRVCMDRLAVRTIVLFRKARLKRPLTEPSYRYYRDSGDALSGDVSPLDRPRRAIVARGSRSAGVPLTLPFEGRMRSNDLQQAQRLHLYGLVKGLRYLILINDLKAVQHLRARLAWALKHSNLAFARRP